jgi:membrane protein DedA with SNARE-associated domain
MIEELIQRFGYLAIVIGTFLEGETVLLLGGFAAHRGYLKLAGVIAAAFVGSLFGDWLYFETGRRKGMAFLEERPAWRSRVDRVLQMVHTHQTLLILSFRFLYGIRTVAPFALGASGVPPLRFALLNIPSAAIWAAAFGTLGYVLGNTLEAVMGDLAHYEHLVFAAIVAAGLAAWGWRSFGVRRQGTVPL